MTVRLRIADASDIPAIGTVMAAAFDPRFGEAWSPAQVAGSLALPEAWARLATIDGRGDDRGGVRAIGFSLCRRIGPEAELLLVAVDPVARRSGVGAALLATARADAAARAADHMFLEVRDGNSGAIALYRRAGFTEVGRRRNYYVGNDARTFDAVTMRAELGSRLK